MKYSQEDLTRFLQAMDPLLGGPTPLLLLDLPNFVLAHYPGSGMEQPPLDFLDRLRNAHSQASLKSRVQIPLRELGVSDFPFMFESRLAPFDAPGLRNLKVNIVDRHDGVVSKILREEKRELAEIEKLGRSAGLSYDGLIDSFCAIDTSIGDMRRKRQQFLDLIELLFGATSVTRAEVALTERLGH